MSFTDEMLARKGILIGQVPVRHSTDRACTACLNLLEGNVSFPAVLDEHRRCHSSSVGHSLKGVCTYCGISLGMGG